MSSHSPSAAAHLSDFERSQREYFEDFFTFLRFPSVSTETQFRDDVIRCHDWLCNYLKQIGFTVESWDTPGYPVIYATWLGAGSDKPTVLFYNHYDVQPVDPLDLWVTPPFEPSLRDGKVYARGAEDNKGQCFYVIRALAALLKKHGRLPVNVKLCIEGEEEHGSAGLRAILPQKRAELAADHLLVFDVGFMDEAHPCLNLGVRGFVAITVEATGSTGDLHSGLFGGVVYNPNRALCEILGSMWDKNGKVTIPGFYDDVLDVSPAEKSQFHFEFDDKLLYQLFKAKPTGGEKNFGPCESAWIRPALEINGFGGGYFGSGFKTVIPAKTVVKLSARIVPDQNPEKVGAAIKRYIEERTPDGIAINVTVEAGTGRPVRSSINAKVVQATARAYEEVNGQKPRFVLDGASIPIGYDLVEATGANLLFAGYGLPSDNIHAPNENFSESQIRKGFATVCRTVEILGEI